MKIRRLWNAPIGKVNLIEKGLIASSVNIELSRAAKEAYDVFSSRKGVMRKDRNCNSSNRRRQRRSTQQSNHTNIANRSHEGNTELLTRNDYFFEYQRVKGYINGASIISESKEIHHLNEVLTSQVESYFRAVNKEVADRLSSLIQSKVMSLNLWAAIQKGTNSYHKSHVHEGVVLSGVYYSNIPKGSAPLILHRPQGHESIESELVDEVIIQPYEGQVILFPPWLFHEVPVPSKTIDNNAARVSFAFNLSGPYIGDPWDLTKDI
mmetsp:Transcript_4429/g.6475  ORF Transcript_4429/g.6475 Transcript_4429/m.6475 type:complete len:265 (-) Transcript_4429:97-891(-)